MHHAFERIELPLEMGEITAEASKHATEMLPQCSIGWMNDVNSKCNEWRLPRFYGIRTLRAFLGDLLGYNYCTKCVKCMELGLQMLNTLGWKADQACW